jgi:hypothetical protein
MALKALSPQELAQTPTLFGTFMGCPGPGGKTVGQLLATYRERCGTLDAAHDPDNPLRVDRFMRDMASERWKEDLVMRIGVFDGGVHLIDGTHRAIAYLACLQDGLCPDHLPGLHVDC